MEQLAQKTSPADDMVARFTSKELAAIRAWQRIPPAGGKTVLLRALFEHCDFHGIITFTQSVKRASGVELWPAQIEAARQFLFLPPTQRKRLVLALMEMEGGK